MRIKTNIYHCTADNGEKYEDFTSFSATIQARNQKEADRLGLEYLVASTGIYKEKLCNFSADLRFENIEMEVETPTPFKRDIGSNTLTYHFDQDVLNLDSGCDTITFDGEDEIQLVGNYIQNLLVKIKA